MKKIIALLLAALLLMSLCACADTKNPQSDPAADDEGQNTPDTPDEPEEDTETPLTADTMPHIDGSTATIPLSEGLVQVLLGYTPEQAADYVHHNRTHAAYENLINGDADIIFVTPPSAEEQKMMEDSGIDFDVICVTLDAFVFLVNSQNPVQSVPLEKLRAVYRGEITNWKDLGGNDLPIIAYQRPDNSGSQTLMYQLVVPADQIMQAPEELKPGSMDGLVDAVSAYDGSDGALGYSVYYYASDMYVNEGSRLLAVDGITPTADTLRDGTYPLISGYYAVLRKDAGADSPARRLLNYLLSEQGQQVAEAMGYVPLP
ncbi:MAG: substrate-binding domain-containing protein [Clostridiaceae bacterium]|nr:substrate-binding domain-containing protein [Clostridiaceae bacterium]